MKTTKPITKAIVFSTDPNDPPYWPKNMSIEDKLRRLKLLAPEKWKGADILIDHALRESWPQQPRRRKAGA